jgi:hypothetical protein
MNEEMNKDSIGFPNIPESLTLDTKPYKSGQSSGKYNIHHSET